MFQYFYEAPSRASAFIVCINRILETSLIEVKNHACHNAKELNFRVLCLIKKKEVWLNYSWGE